MIKIRYIPAVYIALFFVSGIIAAYFLVLLNNYFLLKLLLISELIFFLYYLICKLQNNKSSFFFLIAVLFLFIGTFLYTYQEYKYFSDYSAANYYNYEKRVEVRGELNFDLGDLNSNKVYLKPDNINGNKVKYGKIIIYSEKLKNYQNGDLIYLNLSLSKADRALNPGSFCYYSYLKNKGIYLQGREADNIVLVKKNKDLKSYLIIYKKNLLNNIDNLFKAKNAAFIKAILLGERSDLSYEQESLLRDAGASHLLAISGLHVSIIILTFSYILFKIIVDRKIALYLLSAASFFYMIIVGASVSIIRASLLALLFLWSSEFNREGNFLNIIAFTLIINLLIDPLALFNVSLQLSYLLVLSLFYLTPILKPYLGSVLAVSASAQLGSLAVTAYYFNEYAYIALITNIWLIPLITIFLPFIFIFVFISSINPAFFMPFTALIEIFLSILFKILDLMVQIQGRPLVIAEPAEIIVLIYYLSLFTFSFLTKKTFIPFSIEKNKSWKYLNTLIFIVVFILLFINFNSALLEINYLAVGQGDGIFIKFPDGQNMLIDTGPPGRDGRNIEYNIISFLNKYGISKIDYLMISHFHADHVGGLKHLFKRREIKNIMLPPFKEKTIYHQILEKKLNKYPQTELHFLIEEMNFEISGSNIFILNPEKNRIYDNINSNSIAFLLNYKEKNFIFTGDLYKKNEKRIINKYNLPQIDVLKAAHHGSNTSSSINFLNEINPALVVIPVGENNFGHPSKEIINKFKQKNIKYLRTDQSGAVRIKTDGKEIFLKIFKEDF